MNKRIVFLLVVLTCAAAVLPAESRLRFSADADTAWSAGNTSYLMEEWSAGVSSELVFPLNTLMAGVTIGLDSNRGNRLLWSLEIGAYTNLLNPYGLMKDSDWYLSPGYPPAYFSYTESDALMRSYLAAASFALSVFSLDWLTLEAALGYRFQYIDQDIMGYNGWQYVDVYIDAVNDAEDGWYSVLYGISGNEEALTYKILFHLPSLGLSLSIVPTPRLTATLSGGLLLVYTSDEDDHVLRNKLSTAQGFGFGGHAEAEVRLTLGDLKARVRPYVALAGSFLALRADTEQTQRWYGDDPGTVGDDTGTVLTRISHLITSQQFMASLKVGVAF